MQSMHIMHFMQIIQIMQSYKTMQIMQNMQVMQIMQGYKTMHIMQTMQNMQLMQIMQGYKTMHFMQSMHVCRKAEQTLLLLSSFAPLGPEGQGGCFDSPSLGPLDSLPTRSDQGMSPWTQKGKVALGVWLKKLFTAL